MARAAKAGLPALWNNLVSELRSTACNFAIISSEELAVLDATSIAFIRDMLREFELFLVVYIREQLDYIEAMYNQNIKTAKDTRTRDQFLADFLETNEANYFQLLERWTTALRPTKSSIRLYQKSALENGDIIDDFCSLLSIPAEQLTRPKTKLNTGVNNKYLELLRHVNMLDVSINQKNPKIVSVLIDFENRSATANPPLYGTEQRAVVRAFFEESNRKVASQYLPELSVSSRLFAMEDPTLDDLASKRVEAEALVPLLVHLLLKS